MLYVLCEIFLMGYKCQYILLIFGSLDYARKLATRGLRMLVFPKMNAKILLTVILFTIDNIWLSTHMEKTVLCISIRTPLWTVSLITVAPVV